MSDFFHTVAGHRLVEHTLPQLLVQLDRLNQNLERLARTPEPSIPTAPETSMRIKITSDGRVLDGTPEQILKQMQTIAFGREAQSLGDYVDWIADNLARLSGLTLRLEGDTGAARARSLVEQMIAHGLAERLA